MSVNAIDQTGIQIQTLADIVAEVENGTPAYPGMLQIYGPSINVAPNSPDGQMIAIVAQAKLDMLQLIVQDYNARDPDQAVGVALDQICAINGVFRQVGTFTITPITVVTSASVTLKGLDTAPSAPFTVADATGNRYNLVTTFSGGPATSVLTFQAATLGAVTPTLNTITIISTIQLGVTSVNNPSAATTIGTTEESDFSLRIRRANSVAIGSKGFFDSLYGALTDTAGVTSVNLLENVTNTTDGNSIPGHSIWTIVAGGLNSDVAQAIYVKRNAGCGMKGGVSVAILQVDGSSFSVKFDRPTSENLWIQLNMTAITGSAPAATYIRAQLVAQLTYQIGQSASASTIVVLLQSLAPNCYFDTVNISPDGSTWTPVLATTAVNYQWSLNIVRIYVNGTHG